MDHEQNPIADKIAAAMVREDRSKKWTAERAAIPVTTFNRKLLDGSFTVPELSRIARALGTTVSSLIPEAVLSGR